jgi:hypothetical protein
MRIKELLILVFIFIAVAYCKKEKPKASPDNILYHKFIPEIAVSTINHYIPNQDPESCDDFPVPDSATMRINLDLNGDSAYDYYIEATHFRTHWGSASIHCGQYEFNIFIHGLGIKDSISVTDQTVVKYNSTNNSINNNGRWDTQGTIYLRGQGIFLPFFDFSDQYIGIKIGKNFGWIHISPKQNNGIIIQECAINLTENNKILAGQIQ